ncbi:helix-turn-helix transcriptional regulator [Nocardia sp. NPDC004722]
MSAEAVDTGEPLRSPTLPERSAGSFLRELRERRDLPRAQVARWLRMQPNSLGVIENGHRRVAPELVDQFVKVVALTATEERHLRKLAAASRPAKSKARAKLDNEATLPSYDHAVSEDMQAGLDAITPHAAAWVDPMWRILASNPAYRLAYPGLTESGNVLTWFFRCPSSKATMLDWEGEAALTVAWLRTIVDEHGNPAWARELLRDLSDSEDFARMWRAGAVTLSRKSPYMHLWDSRYGQPYTLLVQITRGPGDLPPMQYFLGIRMGYSGGDDLLERAGRR